MYSHERAPLDALPTRGFTERSHWGDKKWERGGETAKIRDYCEATRETLSVVFCVQLLRGFFRKDVYQKNKV